MKVFVTGHLGYIGTHLVDVLLQAGHHVTGCDLGIFADCGWESFPKPQRELVKDVRSLTQQDLEGHDCVMHLAALSNDPMGDIDSELTKSINRDASIQIARLAKNAGVGRFLFSGSCSVYGKGNKLDLCESDPLSPLTAYAESKIETEHRVSELAGDDFVPVFLRNATAYGHSPALRIDLVVNNLLAAAVALGEIRIQSDGEPWRPLIHCRDIARAFLALAEAPADTVRSKAINIGANAENYQVKDVAELVKQVLPTASVTYTGETGNDPRSYRVSFDYLNQLLPEFQLQYTLATGIEELHRKFVEHGFQTTDFQGSQFVRMRTLQNRLDRLMVSI